MQFKYSKHHMVTDTHWATLLAGWANLLANTHAHVPTGNNNQ